MPSDSGVAKQYSDYARQIEETLDELQYMQETPRLVTSPDEREALEREIRQRTDLLGSLLVGNPEGQKTRMHLFTRDYAHASWAPRLEFDRVMPPIRPSGGEETVEWQAYVVTENRILRHQITGRIRVSDGERKALAEPRPDIGQAGPQGRGHAR